MLDLSQKRVTFVTGKGGTGKTAVAVGLAKALARRGRRVLLLELDSQRPSIPSYFGGQVGFEPRVLGVRLEGANLDFFGCLRAYVASVVPVKRLVNLVLRNKVVKVFLTATPGARELVLLSRLWELSCDPRWEHIVVDLPSSGHAVALFHCPGAVRRVFRRGPLRNRGDEIVQRFSDPAVSQLIFCALPEEMPINETLETREKIHKLELPPIGGVLLNRYPDESFGDTEAQLLDRLDELMAGGWPGTNRRKQHIAAAVSEAQETRRQQRQAEEGLQRLRDSFGEAVAWLPILPGTHAQVADSLSLLIAGGFS